MMLLPDGTCGHKGTTFCHLAALGRAGQETLHKGRLTLRKENKAGLLWSSVPPFVNRFIRKRTSLIAQSVKNPPAIQETPVQFLGWEDPLERARLPTPAFLGFPCGSAGKECGRTGFGRSPGEGKGYSLQYSGLENFTDYIVPGVAKSGTWLSDFHL